MLRRFIVENYRSFLGPLVLDLSTTHDYRFGKEFVRNGIVNTALVYGRNASGKTNLGHAISDIHDNIERSAYTTSARSGSFANADSGSDIARFSYKFDFDGTQAEYAYEKDSAGKLHSERLLVDGEVVFERSGRSAESVKKGKLGLVGADQLNWRFTSDSASVLGYLVNNVQTDGGGVLFELREFASGTRNGSISNIGKIDIGKALDSIVDKHLDQQLDQFLSSFGVDEHLVVREGPDGTRELYSAHKRPVRFRDVCSSGTETLVRLFILADRLASTSFYFFDEFDANCHFELAEQVLQFLGKTDRQGILTTHNTSLMSNAVMRPDCYYVISHEGWVKPLPSLTERELRQGHNLERLYRAGEFGA